MQSKQSAALVGQLTLFAIACLIAAFVVIVFEGGKLSYQLGKFLRLWHHAASQRSQSLSSPNPKSFEPEPDPWELPSEALPIIQQPLQQAPSKPVLYLLPAAQNPQADYTGMSIRKLKAIARDRHIPHYGRMTKAQLLKTLTAA